MKEFYFALERLLMIKFQNILSRRYWKSLIWGKLHRKDYKNLISYCMFIGYQRSGHSYIGALLDAHPNTAIGMEVDALNLVDLNYNRNQLFFCLANNAKIFTKVLENVWTGYSYAVPESSQGKFNKLLVIGDKKGGKSTLRLGEKPELFEKLIKLTKLPVKVIHIIRNPFDNISTMCLRYIERGLPFDDKVFQSKIDRYFEKVEINNILRANNEYSIIEIYQEAFIANPKKELGKIIQFIGLNDVDGYLDKCASTTYKTPHKSRNKIEWSEEFKQQVQNKINKYSFLKHYSFND